MKRKRHSRRGAILLAELIVTVGLLTGVLAVGMRAVATARHLRERAAVMTHLYAPAEIADLGLKPTPGLSGVVTVRAVPGLELREVGVRLECPTASGLAKAELATWRGKGMP